MLMVAEVSEGKLYTFGRQIWAPWEEGTVVVPRISHIIF